jgi:hypothetical protein
MKKLWLGWGMNRVMRPKMLLIGADSLPLGILAQASWRANRWKRPRVVTRGKRFFHIHGDAPCSNATTPKRLGSCCPVERVCFDHTARVLAVAERRLRRADQLDYVVRRWLIPIPFEEGTRSMPKRLPFGAADYPIFKTQSGRASVNSTPLRDPCPPGSLTFSENLSNEVISPKHLPETVMRARLE